MLDRGEFITIAEFERDVAGHINRVRKSRAPATLTRGGKPAAIVLSLGQFKDLEAAKEKMEVLDAINRGRADIAAGRTKPWPEVRRRLLKRLERNLRKARR